MNKINKIGTIVFVFIIAVLYLPIFFLVFFSFSESSIPGIWTKFSLKWFKQIFDNANLIDAFATSCKIAIISATCATALSLMSAIATCGRKRFFGQKLSDRLMIVPLITPEIIIGFSILMLFISIEKMFNITIERGIIALSIGHIIAAISYGHLLIRDRLLCCNTNIEEAAINLGAKPSSILLHITIPAIKGSILASWLFAFATSFDDLVIASFLAGPGSTTLPVLIFSNIRIGISPVINAFAALIICCIVIISILLYVFISKSKKYQNN